jgi:hypothetical protein
MTRWTWAVAVVVLSMVGCEQSQKPALPARAELRTLGGSTIELVPKEGQHPYCLVFTVSEKGIIRQLTMTRENRSIKCEAGKRIFNSSFRVPLEEGKVKAYIFFSDQRIQAGSVAQQLYELQGKPRVTAMDFRLPGAVAVEMLEFTPQEGGEPVTGSQVGTTGVPMDAPVEGAAAAEEEPAMQLEPAAGGEGSQAAPAGGDGAKTAESPSP